MSTLTICGELFNGLNFQCLESVSRKFFQEIVIININDINTTSIVKEIQGSSTEDCKHNVAFDLKTGKTGYALTLPQNGGSIFGSFDKTTNELTGGPQYIHKVNYAVIGISEEIKCFLRSLDKGSFVVAARPLGTNIVEIYGLDNGLQNADYTFDIVGGNGGAVIVLQSLETSPESQIPFIYKSADPIADFDARFEA
jgi:hypothetical protein